MTVATWKIRKADIEDIRVMTSLLKELFSVERDFTFDVHKQRTGLRRLIKETDNVVLVAEIDGLVVGMCTVQTVVSTVEGSLAGVLEDMIVHDKFRGRGIGTSLLSAAERWADEHKLSRVQLLADTANTDALKFYESRGWQITSLICVRKVIRHRSSGQELTHS
jgi:ribosomal protein S18 acetylase RimI-like enzyme